MMTHVSNSHSIENKTNSRTKEMRYLARSVGILALLTGLIYLRVVAVEALASLQTNRETAVLFLLGLLIVAMTGLVCGWRWELVGGLITVVSALAIGILTFFSITDYPLFSALAYSSPFFIAGILLLGCWKRSHTTQ
jgi:putative Mn2+ efflux pump MntP